MITGELKNKIDGIWEIFWMNGMTNPLTVIEQITYLLFLKILDEKTELAETTFSQESQNCRWSVFRQYEPEEQFRNMTEHVFPFIKETLPSGNNTPFAHFMKDAVFLIPSPRMLAKVIDAIDSLSVQDRDIMGDIYEYLLARIAISGTNGQFRTPRHIIQMIVALMEPKPEDTICDPAMGSAGFLCAAAEYLAKQQCNAASYSGFDTDQTMLRIGSMNLMLHGIPAPNIRWMDALSAQNPYHDRFSLIMANPPFKGTLDNETVADDLLTITDTKKTELLFLILFLRMLKNGGRCAAIVPEGVLFGNSKAHRSVRKELIENNKLEAVIAMPAGVFRPYAGVSTAILVFSKSKTEQTTDVWFYDMQSDGYTMDDKRSPVSENDIPDILYRFHHREQEKQRDRTDQSFFVSKEEITEHHYDLSVHKYRKNKTEAIAYPPQEEIMARLHTLQNEIAAGLQKLEELLHE